MSTSVMTPACSISVSGVFRAPDKQSSETKLGGVAAGNDYAGYKKKDYPLDSGVLYRNPSLTIIAALIQARAGGGGPQST